MELSEEFVRKAVEERPRRDEIERAVAYQDRIRMHVSPKVSAEGYMGASRPLLDFFAFVDGILPSDKAKAFRQLFRFPLKTNEVTSVIFDRLSRVFEGRNPAFSYQFASPGHREDWERYRHERLREPDVWREYAWEMFKTEICSVMVCDMPPSGAPDGLPEPYFYFVPIADVLDFGCGPGGMEWLVWRQSDGRIAAVDASRYMLFDGKDGKVGALLSDSPHPLGYCPARFFWDAPLRMGEEAMRAHPLARALEMLDWYLFFHTSKRYLDLYGSYPIYSSYEIDCDFSDEEGHTCSGGILKNPDGHYWLDRNGVPVSCPKCGKKRMIGPGTLLEIPAPQRDVPDMKNPVQLLSIDASSLNYAVKEEERLKEEIISAVCGSDAPTMDEGAYAEIQVKANFESQTTVLNRIKKGFEGAQRFVDETVCRLRYGVGSLVSARVSYGTDFFIMTEAELRDRYRRAREAGASEGELDSLQARIVEAENRNNPDQLLRLSTLAELEPFRHMTAAEVVELSEKGLAPAEDVQIKLRFPDYIRRFERENMNVADFGSQAGFRGKIETITEKLREYAREDIGRIGGGEARGGASVPRGADTQNEV